jgi:hypothetical protein
MADPNLCEFLSLTAVRSAANPQRQQIDENPNFFVVHQAKQSRAIGLTSLLAAATTNPPVSGFKKKDQTMNEQISGRPIGANPPFIVEHLKPVLIEQEFTKMSTKIEQFSYALKIVALTQLYMELSLPLPAAIRAAEADLL